MQLSAMPGMLVLSMMLTTNSCKANKRILSYLILYISLYIYLSLSLSACVSYSFYNFLSLTLTLPFSPILPPSLSLCLFSYHSLSLLISPPSLPLSLCLSLCLSLYIRVSLLYLYLPLS